MAKRNKNRDRESFSSTARAVVSRAIRRDGFDAAARAGAFDPIDLAPSVTLPNAERWRRLVPTTAPRVGGGSPGYVVRASHRPVSVAAGPPAALKPNKAHVVLAPMRVEGRPTRASSLGSALNSSPASSTVRQSHRQDSPKVRDQSTCKERPDNKKRTRGRGGPRKFIPWCGR